MKNTHFSFAKLYQAAVISLVISACGGLKEEVPEKYNILFISVDDLRPELGCYGVSDIKSPNIDKLAASSVVFNRAYCQSAICMPSRASLLSGVRPEHFDSNGKLNTGSTDQNLPGIVTLPQHFKENGYQTISVGKIYHHNTDDEDAWTKRYKETFNIDEVLIHGYSSGYQNAEYRRQLLNYTGVFKDKTRWDSLRPPAVEITDTPDTMHPDGFITQATVKELKRLKVTQEPFFLAAGFYRPHLPFTPPKKYWDMYERSEIDTADNPFSPQNGIGYHNWNELRRYGDIPRTGPLSEEKALELKHGYYASVSFIDAQIGIILGELEALGLAENTIVVVWGDHGWNLGEHGLWCKHTNYEISTRTVLMIKVPGMTKGLKTEALSGLIDIYPTLCELTGLHAPETVEGVSLMPILTGEKDKVQDQVFSLYFNSYSMRTQRYRFTKYFKPEKLRNSEKDTTGIYELYDHQNDPDENFNIAYEPENRKLVLTLDQQLTVNGYLADCF